MVGVDTLRRSVASRPRGRAPIGFPNWDEQSQVVRNDAGELASLKKVLLERRQQRKAEKRRAKQLARAMGVISAEATRAPPHPVHPHCTLRSLSISVPPSCADDRGGFILDEAPPDQSEAGDFVDATALRYLHADQRRQRRRNMAGRTGRRGRPIDANSRRQQELAPRAAAGSTAARRGRPVYPQRQQELAERAARREARQAEQRCVTPCYSQSSECVRE